MLCKNLIKSEDSYLDELREKHLAELAPEIAEQTRLMTKLVGMSQKIWGTVFSQHSALPWIRALPVGHNIKQAELPSRIP